MESKELEKKAFELGYRAVGKYKAPVNDPELMKLTRSAKVGSMTPVLKAWHQGFAKANLKESKQFHSAAPAVVSGNLDPIGKREANLIPPKFAMLLNDIGEDNNTVLRLLVTYPNGDSIVVPPANEPGAEDGNSLLAMVLDFFGTENEETVRVLTAALDRVRKVNTDDNVSVTESTIKEVFTSPTEKIEIWKKIHMTIQRILQSSIFHGKIVDSKSPDFIKIKLVSGNVNNFAKLVSQSVPITNFKWGFGIDAHGFGITSTNGYILIYNHQYQKQNLKEENISDRYQKMVDALNVLSSEPSKSPASMTKLEAIGVIRDMGYPDEKIIYALSAAGHSQEEINELLELARLGVK